MNFHAVHHIRWTANSESDDCRNHFLWFSLIKSSFFERRIKVNSEPQTYVKAVVYALQRDLGDKHTRRSTKWRLFRAFSVCLLFKDQRHLNAWLHEKTFILGLRFNFHLFHQMKCSPSYMMNSKFGKRWWSKSFYLIFIDKITLWFDQNELNSLI